MEDFRAIAAICLSCVSAYLVFDIFTNGFSWALLLAAIVGFWLVHLIWPRDADRESPWYDLLEFVFDLPYRCMAMFFRGLGRSFRDGGGGGFDV